jgi:putative transposase
MPARRLIYLVKKTTTYREAKYYEKKKRRFLKGLYKATDEKDDIVFIDETGFEPEAYRSHGRCPKGLRVYGEKPSGKRPRTSLIGGYLNNKLIAPVTFNGTCNAALFNAWLEQHLLPTLTPGSVIVLDNAAFHKSRKTLELIKAAGCKILFLPPYSPHLNPIEKLWGNIKRAWSYASNLTINQFLALGVYIWD